MSIASFKTEPENSLIDTLNRLRALETREQLTVLPVHYNSANAKRREVLKKEWEKQILIHEHNISTCEEYANRLIVNKTEQRLFEENSRLAAGQPHKTYLQYKQVCEGEKNFYFPQPPEYENEFVFITDTDCTLIQSLTVAKAGKEEYILAKHHLPDSITFVPGLADLKYKTTTPKVEEPIKVEEVEKPTETVEEELLTSPSISTPSLDNSSELLQEKLSSRQKFKRKLDSLTPSKLKAALKSLINKSKNNTPRSSSEDSMSKDPPKDPKNIPPTGAGPLHPEVEQFLKSDEFHNLLLARVDALVKKQNEEIILRSGRKIPKRNPPEDPEYGQEGDQGEGADPSSQAEINRLTREVAHLKLQQKPLRNNALTERSEIGDLKNNLAEMARLMTTMQSEVRQNGLTAEERQRLITLSEPSSVAAPILVYTLMFPTNIISDEEYRTQLSILKAPAVVATIGIFDPDNNPKADFRETWERIQNYTRNYQLYEHEYVDILMAVMKGSAGTCLSDMIREFDGRLQNILEAIQDIYVPQHTIFDDVDELTKFTRPKGENIRTTLRRASLIVYKLRAQCAPAAWPERRHHMLLALIKQVIDPKTLRHLHAKELECALVKTQLDLNAIINIIALHEQTHDLLPRTDLRLRYNINSMQIIEHNEGDTHSVKSLTMEDKSRQSRNDSRRRSASRELVHTPRSKSSQSPYRSTDKGRNSNRKRTESNQNYERSKQTERENRRVTYHTKEPNNSQRRTDGRRDYRGGSSIDRERSRSQSSGGRSRQSSYTDNKNREKNSTYKNYSNNSTNRREQKSKSNLGEKGDNKTKYTKTFDAGKNTVTLHFYKCNTCPSLHPEGEECQQPSYKLNP